MAHFSMRADFKGLCGKGLPRCEPGQLVFRYRPFYLVYNNMNNAIFNA